MERNENRKLLKANEHINVSCSNVMQRKELSVEVIGEILSRVRVVRDVIRASVTCRTWHEAYRRNLHTLSFNSCEDKCFYSKLPTNQLEMFVTRVLSQTSGLHKLSILLDDRCGKPEFSASTVMAWLMFTGERLYELSYNVKTTPSINLFEVCGRQKLEVLNLYEYFISGIEPNFQRFPCLMSLSLIRVCISVLDLNSLLKAFPRIESLNIDSLTLMDEEDGTIQLCSPTLKTVFLSRIYINMNFVLEADNIEYLHVENCCLTVLKLIGNRTLKLFKVDSTHVHHLDIGELVGLESLDICKTSIPWSKISPMVLKASQLRKVRLWCSFMHDVSFERLAVCLPQLSHLSIFLKNGTRMYDLEGSSNLENVVVLELGWHYKVNNFWEWAHNVLQRCPNVKKLIVQVMIYPWKNHNDCEFLNKHTSLLFEIMRRYQHIDVQFKHNHPI